MYPVNAADTAEVDSSYPIAFSQAGTGDKAKGMNSLKFVHGGEMTGHMVSSDLKGGFAIANTGDNRIFTDILILAAIDADSLDPDFSMSLSLPGQTPYNLDANDFCYYDSPFGRPSGFYSITDPNEDGISYAFDNGMVTVYGVGDISLSQGSSMTINYQFNDLPGAAVFSVYGFVGTDPYPTIYHTNRAFVDQNDSKHNPVSTFAVTIKGDLNGDLKVDFLDIALLADNWLVGSVR